MAPPADKKKGAAKAAAPAAGAKKENKPPAAAPAAAKKPAAAPAAAPAAKKPAAEAAKPKAAPPAAKPKVEVKKEEPKKKAAPAEPAKVDAPKAKAPAAKKETVKKAKKPAPKKLNTKQQLRGKGVVSKKKKTATKFTIDCTLPAEDQLFNSSDFEKFLKEKIKINGKLGNLANAVSLERGDKPSKIVVNANIAFSKRYLKYLTKKYLKKHLLRDTLRVISTGRDGYELRYFQIGNEADDDEEDNE